MWEAAREVKFRGPDGGHGTGIHWRMANPQRPPLPPAVIEALKKGNKVEAIKLMRTAATTTAYVSQHAPARAHLSRPGLSPGEVPSSQGMGAWVMLVMVGAVVIYALL